MSEELELAKRLRSITEYDVYAAPFTIAQRCHAGADAIERLVKERDEALALCTRSAQLNQTAATVLSARRRADAADARVAEMEEALRPFIAHNSSEEFVTLKVRSADITRARNCVSTVSPKTAGGC